MPWLQPQRPCWAAGDAGGIGATDAGAFIGVDEGQACVEVVDQNDIYRAGGHAAVAAGAERAKLGLLNGSWRSLFLPPLFHDEVNGLPDGRLFDPVESEPAECKERL